MQKPVILLLNGPGGAGKSTVSQLVAKKLENCAVIDADVIRNMVVSGFINPFLAEGVDQYTLGMHNTAQLARSFYDAGYSVVVDGGATRKKYLDIYYDKLHGANLVNILLLPSNESLVKRDAGRQGKAHLGEEKITWLHDLFGSWYEEEKRWKVLDNTNLTPEETASALFEELAVVKG